MRIGAVFPHEVKLERPSDLTYLLVGLEELGFDYVTVFDHVGGAPMSQLSGLAVIPYTNSSPFFETLVLLGYAAAATTSLGLATGVLVLPQRQVVLAAKQLATIDQISGGRLRVGVGVGWNPAEYEAMGATFSRRGDLLDEQVHLMRALWRDELVTAAGGLHRWTGIGIEPRPETPPEVWFGGIAPRSLRRAARIGDGWIPPMMDTETGELPDVDTAIYTLGRLLDEAGRGWDGFGIEGRLRWNPRIQDRSVVTDAAEYWASRGATHFAVSAVPADGMKATVQDHLGVFYDAKDALEA